MFVGKDLFLKKAESFQCLLRFSKKCEIDGSATVRCPRKKIFLHARNKG